jgi:hypothetical protein
MRPAAALIACALAGAGTALANDSVAETAAGGLVLVRNHYIDMVSEDLYLSRLEVRVRYVFRNRAPRDVRVTIAFPMPDRDLSAEEGEEVAWPSDFRTRVAGRPVRMEVERRATLRGADYSALLTRLGVPLTPASHGDSVYRALEALPRAAQDRLARLRLADFATDPGTGRRMATPFWTVRETWHWDQTFPAGRDLVIEHRYRPGLGGSAGSGLYSAELRQNDYERERIARYCIDADFLAAVERMAAQSAGGTPWLSEDWLSYVLTTGANWRSPIGDFRLVIDKGDPRTLVSFCGEGVRRISPTQFEIRRRNWRPTRDLHVLFLHSPGG